MCCSINGGDEHVPARHDPRRLVEGRQLGVLRRRPALQHRLQRDVRSCGCGSSGICAPGCQQLRLPLRHRFVRRAPRVLQPVPLRAVPPGGALRRRGRVPRRSCARRRGSSTPRARPRARPSNATALHDAPCLHTTAASASRRCSRSAPRRHRVRRRGMLNAPIVGMDATPTRQRATGSSPPTAASSPSATPRSTARLGGKHLNQPIVGMAPHADRQGLLARRGRRRHLHLRRRALPRLDRRQAPQPADRRHGRDADRQGLLARRRRRRHLHLRRRRASTARPAARTLNKPIVGMARDADAATATGSSRPTAASSRSATRKFHGSLGGDAPARADRRHGARRRRARATGWSATDGGVFAFGDAHVLRPRHAQRHPRSRSTSPGARPATATGSSPTSPIRR